MDSLITAGARALASGDALGALNYIALRDDPPALALRGIAMAQLGDLARARMLLRQAARAFGPREALARARCVTAEAEIALVCRDLGSPLKPLDNAFQVLRRHEDHANAAHARYLKARYLLLVGRLDEAERLLAAFNPAPLSPASRASFELVNAGIAMRRLRIKAARAALERASAIARQTGIASLAAEVKSAAESLEIPAARMIARGKQNTVRLEDVETLLASKALVIDACRHVIAQAGQVIPLETRPVLFALARSLAEASPGGASRATLLSRAFGAKHVDESHRVRLRVEIGRLRKLLSTIASIEATSDGFSLCPRGARDPVVLAPLTGEANAHVLALLGDGESWSSSALALALGASQRTVQRALDELLAAGKVQAVGKARARRWMAPPVPGFPTSLLLPTAMPSS
ncbi:helix-turn-helix domain-containing protein [Hyphomicrobium sp. CS1GBMeth3]|uniref:helix-turn-helix domain-containing protein n=1 Tax=Hyphomicrobium sp. CS1GBMeth3 TaxID=1892845 RepID=UPI000930736D|nr:helix-turn-helix domain-containing protein [Hyphomicrobium sp. CS1GBMeth3]